MVIRDPGTRRESSTLTLRDCVSCLKTSTVNNERFGYSLGFSRARQNQSWFGIANAVCSELAFTLKEPDKIDSMVDAQSRAARVRA